MNLLYFGIHTWVSAIGVSIFVKFSSFAQNHNKMWEIEIFAIFFEDKIEKWDAQKFA